MKISAILEELEKMLENNLDERQLLIDKIEKITGRKYCRDNSDICPNCGSNDTIYDDYGQHYHCLNCIKKGKNYIYH